MPIRDVAAVVNPITRASATVDRAAELARRFDARLHLIAAIYYPIYSPELFHLGQSLEDSRTELVDDCYKYLESLRPQDIECSVLAEWGHPFDEALASLTEDLPHDLLVASLRNPHHPSGAEWRMIRTASTPLLLVNGRDWPESPYVLGCVDPTHAHDKPALLDRAILIRAHEIAEALETPLHALHATGLIPDLRASDRSNLDARRGDAIRQLSPIEDLELHFSHSTPPEAIRAFVEARGVDLCVVGSISRTWIMDKLIGGTLREILPDAGSDLLLIPPSEMSRLD